MSRGYAYDHAWTEERVRLVGLESALDPGTRAHLLRLGVGPGRRCLEIGAGGGAIALWLAEHVLPNGKVVATDLETDFLEQQAARSPAVEVLRHDITVEDLPTGFDLVHARWLVEWLPTSARRSGGCSPRRDPVACSSTRNPTSSPSTRPRSPPRSGASCARRWPIWNERARSTANTVAVSSTTSPQPASSMLRRKVAAPSCAAARHQRRTSSA